MVPPAGLGVGVSPDPVRFGVKLNTRELGLTGLRGWLAAARATDRPNLSG